MDEFVTLLENFWITHENDPNDYYKIKRAIDKDMKRFIGELAGWKLIINQKLIKLEKVPDVAESFMGIEEFQEVSDYCLLCAILIYLNDIDEGGQFLLSELIEALERIVHETMEIDFTKYRERKSLVRALGFAQNKQLLKISEGSLSNVENDQNKEILYENTGLSNYFSVHHSYDISDFKTYQDFENVERIYSDNDIGSARINRVYRRLILKPSMYWDSNDNSDSIYLKNQRNSIARHLDCYLDGRLDIHNGSAFYMLSDDNYFGQVHPNDKMLAGLVLFLCAQIKEDLLSTSAMIDSNSNKYLIDKDKFHEMICDCRDKFSAGLSKEYREISEIKLIDSVVRYMINWKMIEIDDNAYLLRDGLFKTAGRYPKDFDFESLSKK